MRYLMPRLKLMQRVEGATSPTKVPRSPTNSQSLLSSTLTESHDFPPFSPTLDCVSHEFMAEDGSPVDEVFNKSLFVDFLDSGSVCVACDHVPMSPYQQTECGHILCKGCVDKNS